MPVTLSGTTDVYANSVHVINNDTYVDLMGAIQGVAGLPPSALDSLQKSQQLLITTQRSPPMSRQSTTPLSREPSVG